MPQSPPPALLRPETNAPMTESEQPAARKPMDPTQPHPEQTQLKLRGGDRGGMCPGRFCFCVPCPIPCDFCII